MAEEDLHCQNQWRCALSNRLDGRDGGEVLHQPFTGDLRAFIQACGVEREGSVLHYQTSQADSHVPVSGESV